MLGTICNILDRSTVQVRESDKIVVIRGLPLEVQLEENNHLRLSLVKEIDDRTVQWNEAVSNIVNILDNRGKDLVVIKQELKELTRRLANENLEEAEEEELFKQVRDRRTRKKNHEDEISKLKAQNSVKVHYRVVKSGLSAVLPPGLIVHPEFLPEPVFWCPRNIPLSKTIQEETSKIEELPVIRFDQFTASGSGIERCFRNAESKFVISTKDDEWLWDSSVDKLVVECKEAEVKYSALVKERGMHEVSYFANFEEGKQLSLAVMYHDCHIKGSPFSVKAEPEQLLLEFSSSGNHNRNWLDAAVQTMSSIPRATLRVLLYDASGVVVYNATGVTTCKWTEEMITSSDKKQWRESKHTNAIPLDNGDRMMIIGKYGGPEVYEHNDFEYDQFRSYNIIINKGWHPSSGWRHPRKMIIGLSAPSVPGWTAPGNLISFSRAGFITSNTQCWPKFTGTFRIYFKAL